MNANRNALEFILRTDGERYGQSLFNDEEYPRKTANYPFNLKWPLGNQRQDVSLEEIGDVFRKAVRDAIEPVQNKKIGILLSGGIDSTFLLYLFRREFPDSEIIAFNTHLGKNHVELNETENAKSSAEFTKTPIRLVDGSPENQIPILNDVLKTTKTVSSAIAHVHLTFEEMAKEGIDIAIAGNGLDSFFAGASLHKAFLGRKKLPIIPSVKSLYKTKYYRKLAIRYGTDKAWFTTRISWNNIGRIVKGSSIDPTKIFTELPGKDLWDKIQEWSIEDASKDAIYVARAAWANNIEIQYPFMTQSIVNLSRNYRPQKMRNKAIIRELMRHYGIPNEIVSRGETSSKLGWGGSHSPYFDYPDWLDIITPQGIQPSDWYTDATVVRYRNGIENRDWRMLHARMALRIIELSN